MFSSRTAWELTDNELSRAHAEARARGDGFVDLTETNPTRIGLALPMAEVEAALVEAGVEGYAPEPFGLRSAREAVARLYRAPIDPAHICLSASTSEAYAWLFKLLCDPGDRVLVPAPSYPLFEYLARLEGVELDAYPSHPADGWHLDLDVLESLAGKRTRAVIVVSPNNPTGAMLRRTELERIGRFCRTRGLAIIADEVFSDYAVASDPELVPTLAGHDACLTFAMNGLSKSALLPQLKLAWTLVQGPPELVAPAVARLEVVADTCLSVASPVQRALPGILALKDRLQAPLKARFSANRRALGRASSASPVTVLPAEGGWSAVLRVPRIRSDEEWAMSLAHEGVLVLPGCFFDLPHDGYLVVSLLADEAAFAEGAARLVSHVTTALARA